MSEQEKFLARWSRRKREGGAEDVAPPAGPGVAQETRRLPEAPANEAKKNDAEKPDKAFDVTQLPSLDSISADTDIRDFLKPGVPADLTRAALRRAWAADPAIRDFIGLSENSWDFNSDEMQGFGPLVPTDNLRKLLAQATGTPEPVEHASNESAEAQAADASDEADNIASNTLDSSSEQDQSAESGPTAAVGPSQTVSPENEMLQSHNSDVASQQDESDHPLPRRRKSGGALPG